MVDTTKVAVTIDIGPAVHQGAGLSRYTERLVSHLLKEEDERLDLTLFYNRHSDHGLPASIAQARSCSVEMGQYRWRLTALASQIMKRPILGDVAPDVGDGPPCPVYHATEHLLPNLAIPSLMTVHDLIFERYPQHHTRRNRLFLKMAMPRFVKAADAIIAVSEHTKRDLIELYRCPGEKIHVIPEGIDAGFKPSSDIEITDVRQRYGIRRSYLFMMGTLEPRKNHATALRALTRLKASGLELQLVITGGAGWLFDPISAQVDKLGLEEDVIFTDYVPQADVPALYSGAVCTLMPSLYEGFGFPVLESMACGTPVVCSNASSLPEVVGDAALMHAPTDHEALAANVQRILAESDLVEGLCQRGRDRAAQYRWSTCAKRTADLYVALSART